LVGRRFLVKPLPFLLAALAAFFEKSAAKTFLELVLQMTDIFHKRMHWCFSKVSLPTFFSKKVGAFFQEIAN